MREAEIEEIRFEGDITSDPSARRHRCDGQYTFLRRTAICCFLVCYLSVSVCLTSGSKNGFITSYLLVAHCSGRKTPRERAGVKNIEVPPAE